MEKSENYAHRRLKSKMNVWMWHCASSLIQCTFSFSQLARKEVNGTSSHTVSAHNYRPKHVLMRHCVHVYIYISKESISNRSTTSKSETNKNNPQRLFTSTADRRDSMMISPFNHCLFLTHSVEVHI